MENYIKDNKEAWEEAFHLRDEAYGNDIGENIEKKNYAYLSKEMIDRLKNYDLSGKTIGQFCCNNGRELLSLLSSSGARDGVGFDIAENMIEFANIKAEELNIHVHFVATNILDIDDSYTNRFDLIIVTIGALCWFKDLSSFFHVVSKCLKNNGVVLINEQHPFTNMLALPGDEGYDEEHPLNFCFSYFTHEWKNNDGMYYITGKSYDSKTFTDYTHSFSEIVSSMTDNGFAVTALKEYQSDLSGMFAKHEHTGFPLSYILEGRK